MGVNMLHTSWLSRFLISCLIGGILVITCTINVSEAADPDLPKIQSEQPLTLEQLLEAAQAHNPDLQKARVALSVNKLLKLGAVGQFLPSVSVGYSISQNKFYNPTFTNPDGTVSTYPLTSTVTTAYFDSLGYYRRGPTETVTYPVPQGERRSSQIYIQLQLSLSLGGREILELHNANKTAQINEFSLANTQVQVMGNIRQQYYLVLADQRLLDLAKRLLDQSNDQLELARVRYEVGSVTQLDVMQAEIDVGNSQNAVLTADQNLKLAREELNRLLGIELTSEYPLVDNFQVIAPSYDVNHLVELAINNRPDFKISELNTQIDKNNVRMNWGNYLPNVSASISHSRSEQSGGNVDFTLEPRNRSTTYSLGLSWPLFDGFNREVALQQAKVNARQAELDRVSLQQSIEQSVRQAYFTLMRVWDQSKVTQKNRDLADRQLQLEQERYRLGSASQLELRSAQVTYSQAETDDINKTLEYLINLALLEEAVGGSLQ
jgi:outer membrane protein